MITQVRALVESKEGVWNPETLAGVQVSLANALALEGERSGKTASLVESLALYRDALKEWTRERVPLDWAMTQINLGNALERRAGGGTGQLEEAVAAYRDAFGKYPRARRSNGPRPRSISALRSECSGSGRAGRRGSMRRLPPIARPSRNIPARARRSIGR